MGPGFKVTPAVELLSILGRGGMGDVWLADHAGLGARVVVKFLSRDLVENDDALSRFKREAMSAAAVKSPHVVQVFDHGVTPDGLPFIVMEYLEGHDLAASIAKGPLPAAEVAEIVGQVARALSRAHQAGIVHRDIKPENIFLCDTGDGELFVKVLDFGIAKAVARAGRNTVTGQVVGTPYYMSPEQIVGASADAKMDEWALAAVTFEALTGRVAFDGDTVGAITLAIHAEPPVPSRVLGSIGPDVDVWFAKAFARAPADRFANAKDMAAALRRALHLGGGDMRDPMPSSELPSGPALPAGEARGALASTHLSSTMSVGADEPARSASRARALVVVVPVLLVSLAVVAFGALRAVASKGDSGASSSEVSSGVAPRPEPSAAVASAIAPPPAAAPASASAPAPAPSAVAHTKTGPAAPKVPGPATKPPAGKPKPGKYDDIQ